MTDWIAAKTIADRLDAVPMSDWPRLLAAALKATNRPEIAHAVLDQTIWLLENEQ